ncbi:MAG: hypothetical protein ACFFC6_15985 [Promethearchaeota archaeon]
MLKRQVISLQLFAWWTDHSAFESKHGLMGIINPQDGIKGKFESYIYSIVL